MPPPIASQCPLFQQPPSHPKAQSPVPSPSAKSHHISPRSHRPQAHCIAPVSSPRVPATPPPIAFRGPSLQSHHISPLSHRPQAHRIPSRPRSNVTPQSHPIGPLFHRPHHIPFAPVPSPLELPITSYWPPVPSPTLGPVPSGPQSHPTGPLFHWAPNRLPWAPAPMVQPTASHWSTHTMPLQIVSHWLPPQRSPITSHYIPSLLGWLR